MPRVATTRVTRQSVQEVAGTVPGDPLFIIVYVCARPSFIACNLILMALGVDEHNIKELLHAEVYLYKHSSIN